MMRTRAKKVLLVAPEIFGKKLSSDYENVTHIHALNRLFPSIYNINPHLIIFDYSYIGKDMEQIVRRIRTNSFYNKTKICCYKNKAEFKNDGLLKAIGVDHFIYDADLEAAQKSKEVPSVFAEILDRSLLSMLINVAH